MSKGLRNDQTIALFGLLIDYFICYCNIIKLTDIQESEMYVHKQG